MKKRYDLVKVQSILRKHKIIFQDGKVWKMKGSKKLELKNFNLNEFLRRYL